ncbi:YpeB-like protein with putative protease inhibitory function [Actinomadura pelletieri DSM 43383]|uniref:YpeB-like protein with putative protease inhibitory function n=1 Tax=Actinomadura pelletieri DSM 43383 TaxID=1120940 RepID=A0A495QH36_9ACTN|nr:PepSY domain-containing protein [Actinomadura pelletieri]RKS71158.1 YpeB-like protein with putative protease inhibitory function [Actinomadura pelletieri DSM 43383]
MRFAAKNALTARRRLLLTAIAAGAVAAPAGAAATAIAAGDDERVSPVAARLNVERAAGVALAAAPGGHIEGLEIDFNGRTLIWEADVLAGDGTAREMHIDAHDGRVLADQVDPPEEGEDADGCDDSKPDDGATEHTDPVTALRSAKITASRAARAAVATVSGTATSIDFEYRRTGSVWEVDITADDGGQHTLRVNAATGEVTPGAAGQDDG